MGVYIRLSPEIGGRVLIGAWALKGRNTVYVLLKMYFLRVS